MSAILCTNAKSCSRSFSFGFASGTAITAAWALLKAYSAATPACCKSCYALFGGVSVCFFLLLASAYLLRLAAFSCIYVCVFLEAAVHCLLLHRKCAVNCLQGQGCQEGLMPCLVQVRACVCLFCRRFECTCSIHLRMSFLQSFLSASCAQACCQSMLPLLAPCLQCGVHSERKASHRYKIVYKPVDAVAPTMSAMTSASLPSSSIGALLQATTAATSSARGGSILPGMGGGSPCHSISDSI